jgi:YfiH family protein
LAISAGQVATPRQVHGSRIAAVTVENAGTEIPNTDGLVTNIPGVALLLRFADCQPILLYDPDNHALGLIHAGWRGVAQAIARRAVERMQEAFGSEPKHLIAGLGPAIGPCCYTVGQNVASAMSYALPDWHQVISQEGDSWQLDLSAANTQHLEAEGVKKVEQAQFCTACHPEIFFSHRAEKGRTGRFAVVAFLQPRIATRPTMGRHSPQSKADQGDSLRPQSLHPPGLPPFESDSGGSQ